MILWSSLPYSFNSMIICKTVSSTTPSSPFINSDILLKLLLRKVSKVPFQWFSQYSHYFLKSLLTYFWWNVYHYNQYLVHIFKSFVLPLLFFVFTCQNHLYTEIKILSPTQHIHSQVNVERHTARLTGLPLISRVQISLWLLISFSFSCQFTLLLSHSCWFSLFSSI